MKETIVTIISLFILAPALSFAGGECDIAREAIQKASIIRKLAIKRPVPCEVHTKEEVTAFVRDAVKTKIPAAKLRNEEVLYKALGIIPESFAYSQGIIDLYVSQIGGYYDPDKHYFVMAGWLPTMMQPTIAAHELTHALQDQYYNLSKFVDPKNENSDDQLARSSLVEGDATAVMTDYVRGLVGQKGIESDVSVDSLLLQNVVGSSLTMGGTIPSSLQNILIFPYTSGLRFVHVLLKKGSYGEVDKAFKRAPASTEEILHPEKYFAAKRDFITITNKDIATYIPAGGKIIYQDTLGEFGTSVLLGQFVSDKMSASKAAEGWGGDRAFLIEGAPHEKERVVWKMHWDTEKDADEYFDVMSEALRKRFPSLPSALRGCGDLLCDAGKGVRVELTKDRSDTVFVVVEGEGK